MGMVNDLLLDYFYSGWHEENRYGSVASGCPQTGVLSPVLWSLVVDKLIGVVT